MRTQLSDATKKILKYISRLPKIVLRNTRKTKEFHVEQKPLTTVHEALTLSNTPPPRAEDAGPMGTHTFRIDNDIKGKAKEKCEMHGSSLDAFLRQCCQSLLDDYRA